MFTDAFDQHSDRVALRQSDGRAATYAELSVLARHVGLARCGQRELVAIFCSNSIDSIAGYVAALEGGHVALLLGGAPDSALNAALLAHFQVSKTWALDTVSGHYQLLDTGRSAPVMDGSLALLLSTSGSTGSKKLVRLSLDNLRSNAASIAQYLGIDVTEKPITTLPMHYSYGLSIVNSHLLSGAEILLTDESIIGRIFWPFARDFGATSFGGVPLTYQLLNRMGLEQMDLPALRYFTQAGGRLDTSLVRHFSAIAQRTGRRFYVMYGQTEATARIAYLPHELAAVHPASIGRPIPGGELAIVSESGAVVSEPNVKGELIYRGPNVMLGYAETVADLALSSQLYGELQTGDIAYRDENGLYFIAGRKKRFIKINGNRVGLDDVESFLAEQGYRVAAIGQDEKLQLLVEGEPDKVIAQLLWQNLSIHPRNCMVQRCATLPRSAAGKVVYPEVARFFNDAEEQGRS
jgi:acyl-CoA synthetase (AMP-forming)/AMP-acid ligase II